MSKESYQQKIKSGKILCDFLFIFCVEKFSSQWNWYVDKTVWVLMKDFFGSSRSGVLNLFDLGAQFFKYKVARDPFKENTVSV